MMRFLPVIAVFFLPHSSSSSRFTAGASEFFVLAGAAAGKQNQRLRLLPFRIGEVAVAKRRAALLARLRVARRRLRSEQFRSASMTCRPRCGRLRGVLPVADNPCRCGSSALGANRTRRDGGNDPDQFKRGYLLTRAAHQSEHFFTAIKSYIGPNQ